MLKTITLQSQQVAAGQNEDVNPAHPTGTYCITHDQKCTKCATVSHAHANENYKTIQ